MPALLYGRILGKDGAVTAALLRATSLPFLVTSSAIGVALGAISAATAAALVSAGLLSVVLFPPLAPARLRRLALAGPGIVEPGPLAHRPMGTQD